MAASDAPLSQALRGKGGVFMRALMLSCVAALVTAAACEPICVVGDTELSVGEEIPAPDGCNTCTCTQEGTLACTELDCGGVEGEGEGGRRG